MLSIAHSSQKNATPGLWCQWSHKISFGSDIWYRSMWSDWWSMHRANLKVRNNGLFITPNCNSQTFNYFVLTYLFPHIQPIYLVGGGIDSYKFLSEKFQVNLEDTVACWHIKSKDLK